MSSARPPDLHVLDRDREAREQREQLDRLRLEVHALDHEVARVVRLVERGLDRVR